MTTEENLIKELEKHPKDLRVFINKGNKKSEINIMMAELSVELEEINYPYSETNTKDSFLILDYK